MNQLKCITNTSKRQVVLRSKTLAPITLQPEDFIHMDTRRMASYMLAILKDSISITAERDATEEDVQAIANATIIEVNTDADEETATSLLGRAKKVILGVGGNSRKRTNKRKAK